MSAATNESALVVKTGGRGSVFDVVDALFSIFIVSLLSFELMVFSNFEMKLYDVVPNPFP